ncbi:hypothetical protein QBC46DRAFT_170114 [Diplogelasinospora grovesii]|uniref:Uncharacterized protein n=1 Tax=Diplogelasinospora grovesii TaxID=303347 RepID=A0AAN6N2M6_9PEZI|nr:hypothetical protein QBC46DRAFT_170114 [Diplogelasinospora grovesii]
MSLKPILSLSTPVTANFPHIPPPPSASELRSAISLPSAISERTPLSAISRTSAFRDPIPSGGLPSAGLPSAGPTSAAIKMESDLLKTPITPPVAYLDFLKSMSLVSPSLASPPQTGKGIMFNRTSTASSNLSNTSNASNVSSASSASEKSNDSATSDESEKEKSDEIESAPSTARSDVSCECADKDKHAEKGKGKSTKPAPINTSAQPPTPRGSNHPLSAPPVGPAVFPSMKIPPSPSVSVTAGLYSPRSPLSATSMKSPFDWDAALKSRRFAEASGTKRPAVEAPTANTSSPGPSHKARSSIRHIREVVTRTVTYTPRMAPAPKGKRRKLDTETAVKS